jgi:hypothetical protein
MDPITLIVAALAAGGALGLKETASAAVNDAYAGLKALAKKRLGGGPEAELVLAKHEKAPKTWQAPLMAQLAEAGADGDRDLIEAAQALLSLAGGVSIQAGEKSQIISDSTVHGNAVQIQSGRDVQIGPGGGGG